MIREGKSRNADFILIAAKGGDTTPSEPSEPFEPFEPSVRAQQL
jgi:hypothetical protein